MTDNSTTPPNQTSKTDASTSAEAARDVRDSAAEEARRLRDTATEQAQKRAEGAKEGIADEIGSVGDALRRASDELRSGSPQEQMFGTMAETLADLSDTVRGKGINEMVSDVADFGRRNPLAFLGGAALLGFAGARLARASQSGAQNMGTSDYGRSDYGSSTGASSVGTAPASPASAPATGGAATGSTTPASPAVTTKGPQS
ncbi:hypothetical protein OG2516_03533 [Oceanicola granulosus HTCC2516]|uniref:Nutrient deprivation-induced protein n=1 Tax=Oceanicola granulosus (strain ATCC BAA-861 / DSM 15982 / KCTC 12143 / HTCC2516) TaxID=314256 RepID=Q2CAH9_OCEGH|nr:hypothetical protein [Oceanicola granulosus]EAR49695.1 hypothetical protein OG2516_03533 [Oceanicola granulosus HTCC2516]